MFSLRRSTLALNTWLIAATLFVSSCGDTSDSLSESKKTVTTEESKVVEIGPREAFKSVELATPKLPIPVPPNSKQSALILEAQRLQAEGNSRASIEVLKASAVSNVADAQFLLGVIYTSLANDEEAVKAFERASGLGHELAIFWGGQTNYRLKRFERSTDLFAKSYLLNQPERSDVAPYLVAAVDYYSANQRPSLVRSMQLRDSLLKGMSFEDFLSSSYPVDCQVSKATFLNEVRLHKSISSEVVIPTFETSCEEAEGKDFDRKSYNLLKSNPDVLNTLYQF